MATFTQGIAVSGTVGFSPSVTHYRRNRATSQTGLEVTGQVYRTTNVTIYRRQKAAPQPTILVVPSVYTATNLLRAPRRFRVLAGGLPVDVIAGRHIAGDSGIELVYRIPNKLATRPHLLWPLVGTIHRLAAPLMRWTPVTGADWYEVHVSRTVDFSDRAIRFDSLMTEIQRGIPFGGTFYWRVRAISDSGAFSDFSEVWYFTTAPITPNPELGHAAAARARMLWQFQENADA